MEEFTKMYMQVEQYEYFNWIVWNCLLRSAQGNFFFFFL